MASTRVSGTDPTASRGYWLARAAAGGVAGRFRL